MSPTVDERLASIVRALTEVILPHLPSEASLAQEQVHLAIGHIQILRSQLDQAPAFERGELADAVALAGKLSAVVSGGAATGTALNALAKACGGADGSDVRGQRQAVHVAIDGLVKSVAADGDTASGEALVRTILEHEAIRTRKDREWFAPYGFDTL